MIIPNNNIALISTKELVDLAKDRAKKFKTDGVKTNQIRNFYSSITRMRMEHKRMQMEHNRKTKQHKAIPKEDSNYDLWTELLLLKPKLAYAAGRQKAVRETFQPFMDWAIDATLTAQSRGSSKKGLENFFLLVESIVAYHKFYGDK